MPEVRGTSGLLQSFERELADRLQHPEALPRVAEKALVDQRLQRVQVGICDNCCGFERAAAGEHREPGKEPPLLFAEEPVAPFDRRSQRLLPRLGIAAAFEQIEPLRKALQDLGRGEHARPGRRQLDRERQVV